MRKYNIVSSFSGEKGGGQGITVEEITKVRTRVEIMDLVLNYNLDSAWYKKGHRLYKSLVVVRNFS